MLVGQLVHVVPPGDVVEVPRAHMSHDVLPVRGCAVPVAHSAHVDAEVAPAAVDEVPTEQTLHPSPATSEYAPAEHWAHVVRTSESVPVPGAHATHCASVAESVAALTVFLGHG